jgi:hypothetical protein
MLMLTHAWLLDSFLGARCFDPENQDLYLYNICPDFLPIHRCFTSDIPHGVSRFRNLPVRHAKAAFIHFHLMVDDISHHGTIDRVPVKDFNPDSQGYTYLKGRPLLGAIKDLYARQNRPIDHATASYRSHMLIEMTFDLALYQGLSAEGKDLLLFMCDAMQSLKGERLREFADTVGWFYDADPAAVGEAMGMCAPFYTPERMNEFMSLDGRIKVFLRKFGLDASNRAAYKTLEGIMDQGMDLVCDYEAFLDPTLDAIQKVGFNPNRGC